jgi:hypothetical protein
VHVLQQRAIGGAKQRHVGDRQRTQGFAVIAVGETHEFRFLRVPGVAPGVHAHLERDLHRRSAVGGVEAVTEDVAGQCRELLRQPHHRFMGEAGEHGMLEPV